MYFLIIYIIKIKKLKVKWDLVLVFLRMVQQEKDGFSKDKDKIRGENSYNHGNIKGGKRNMMIGLVV